MNQHTKIFLPNFFLSDEGQCPYLPEQRERKLFTLLIGEGAQVDSLHESLNQSGFRRSNHIVYRPACDNCRACLSVRVVARDYKYTRSDRRILRQNKTTHATYMPPRSTDEQYELLTQYLNARHADGAMRDLSRREYKIMAEETSIDSYMIEYRDTETDKLQAVMLGDKVRDGYSLVYSFYDPHDSAAQKGLGSYMILDHIARAQAAARPYVYLGYLVETASKMAYKKRFQPLEAFTNNGWQLYKGGENGA